MDAIISIEVPNVTPIFLIAKLKVMIIIDQRNPLKITHRERESKSPPLLMKNKPTNKRKMNPIKALPRETKTGSTFCTTDLEKIFAPAKKKVAKIINISPVLMLANATFPTETKYMEKIITAKRSQNILESLSFKNTQASNAVKEVVIT